MKKILTLASGLLLALTVSAQQPQEVKSIIVEEHDSAWYARQAEAWQRVCEAEPQSVQPVEDVAATAPARPDTGVCNVHCDGVDYTLLVNL